MAEEKTVVVSGIPEELVGHVLNREATRGAVSEDISQAVIKYTKSKHTWFDAEFALIDDNIVVHFYPKGPVEQAANKQQFLQWWVDGKFPTTLDVVARSHFDADRPRLVAKYTPELYSWWLKAQGFGSLIDPAAFTAKFFEKLDQALEM